MTEVWRAVVVDDDEQDLVALEVILGEAGAPELVLTHAADVAAVRERLADGGCDVLLVDLELGAPADARPADARARALELVAEFGPRWPIVLLAREDDPALVDQALRAGAQDILVRGQFDGPGLRRSIERARLRATLVHELHLVRRRYELATEATQDVIWEWNVVSGEVYCSAALQDLLGFAPSEVGDRMESWVELVHPAEHARFNNSLAHFLAEPLENFRIECRLRHRTRGYRQMRLQGRALIGADGEVERLIGSLRDVTEARARVEALKHDAHHDTLTGAVTRGVLIDRVRQAIERGRRRPGLRTAVLFMDLDRFKPVNDEHGHATGDAALVEVVRRLRSKLRPADTVARLGGDEFAALLEDLDGARDGEVVARRILESLGEPFDLDGRRVELGASVGLAMVVGDGPDPDELLRRADRAMYHAKAAGRGTLAVWAEHIDPPDPLVDVELAPQRSVAERPRLVTRPLTELISRGVVGAELAACHGPGGSPRPIDPAGIEQLLKTLGESAPARRRLRLLDLRVASSCLMTTTTAGLLEQVMDALSEGAAQVRLALPEDSLVLGGGELAAGVRRLRARGHAVLIDDFGERFAPLALLRRGGLDGARLSPRLVERRGDESLLGLVVAHCLEHGFEMVATGVDRERAAERLITAGCAVATGPHLSEPKLVGPELWTQLVADSVQPR